jgi:hypothetical protein
LELKALSDLNSAHFAQVINALKATNYVRGLLVNFGAARLEYKRLILSQHVSKSALANDTAAADTSADGADGRR